MFVSNMNDVHLKVLLQKSHCPRLVFCKGWLSECLRNIPRTMFDFVSFVKIILYAMMIDEQLVVFNVLAWMVVALQPTKKTLVWTFLTQKVLFQKEHSLVKVCSFTKSSSKSSWKYNAFSPPAYTAQHL